MMSNTPYTKFVIIASHRSGSNYLSSLLGSHAHIMSIGEVFNESALFANPGKTYLENNMFAKAFRDIAPVWFVRRFIYGSYPRHIQAVGFRYFYLHAEGKFRSVLEFLQKDRSIAVIHLKRKNLLDSFVSLMKAQRTNIWTVASESSTVQPKIRFPLTAEACTTYFTSMENYAAQFDEYFSDHQMLGVDYETLCRFPGREHKRILSFLGLPLHTLSASTKKLGIQNAAEVVSNYDQLKRHFRHTRWGRFFR